MQEELRRVREQLSVSEFEVSTERINREEAEAEEDLDEERRSRDVTPILAGSSQTTGVTSPISATWRATTWRSNTMRMGLSAIRRSTRMG